MKLLFIQTCAPHGSINAQEGLDAVLMASAFAECGLLFTAEGVLQLVKNQTTAELGVRDFSKTFGALRDYGVKEIYCRSDSMRHYGLDQDDLLLDAAIIDDQGIHQLIRNHDQVLTF